MRKVALLAASALLIPGVAFADGESAAPMSPMFVGVSVGWTQMDMPEKENGAYRFGAAQDPLSVSQADVDGVTYAFGIGKNLTSGWRVGAYARFFDGDGASTQSVVLPGVVFRRGTLNGTTEAAGGVFAGSTGVQTLDVTVTDYSVAVSAGHGLFDFLRGDLILSYGETDTENRDRTLDSLTLEYISNNSFAVSTFELAARLSASIPLSGDLSFSAGGSAGWGLRNIDMNAFQRVYNNGAATLISQSRLGTDLDVDGFIGRADAALDYKFATGTTIGLTASYTHDDIVPVYVAPQYAPVVATVGAPASIATEGQSSMTYGVRLIGRF